MACAVGPVALPPGDLRRSIVAVDSSLSRTLDALEDALAQMQGSACSAWSATPPPQPPPDANAADEMDRMPAAPVLMDTPAVQEQLRRVHAHFSGSPPDGSRSPPGLTASGFGRLLRAARLLGDVCSQVDADLVFCRVVKSRHGRMGLAHMISALSMVALRHFPAERTQASAFHRLLSSHLLLWLLHHDYELASAALRQPGMAAVLERNRSFIDRCFELYLSCPAQPVIPAVAALPNPSLQWPQLVAFAQDFDLCPSLIPWATLARMVCFAGDCALPHRWQAPDSHGLARGQFSLLLGWCALEARHSDALPDERTAAAGFIGGSTGGAGGGGPARGGVAAGCVGTVGSAAVGRAVNPLEALFDRLRASLGNQKMGQLLGDA